MAQSGSGRGTSPLYLPLGEQNKNSQKETVPALFQFPSLGKLFIFPRLKFGRGQRQRLFRLVRGNEMKHTSNKRFNVYHRSEVTGRICRHVVSAMDWEAAQYIRDHWNRRNPRHLRGGAWIDYHDLNPEPITMEVGVESLPLPSAPASFIIG